jgi:hypothetical protein
VLSGEGGKTLRREPITPEPRQPLGGFSHDLREREDCQRFVFSHSVTEFHRAPVHIVFCPASREAEVTTGVMKPMRIPEVGSVVEARRRWIEWFNSRPGLRRRSRIEI